MGTWYTFTTELIYDQEVADELDSDLTDEEKKNPSHFIFQRINFGKAVYFVGHNKNSGGGFYDWPLMTSSSVKMVWCSDEGHKGDFGFE